MKERAGLERGYRRLLACYPKPFRRENEQEILAVLLASAEEGQRRVRLTESAALVRGALRMRLRPASRPPRAVHGAVRLMCAGAVADLAALVTMVVTAASVKAALAKEPGLTTAQWHKVLGLLPFREAGAGIAVGLWLVMAWAINQGRDGARLAFSGFFALISLIMLVALAQHGMVYALADTIAGAAVWFIALVTMVLIFTRQSNTYYRQGARPRTSPAG